jgi:hypothetical protein
MSESIQITAQCGNCALWRQVDFGGPVAIGAPKRGNCYALPPTPCAILNGRQIVGQVNLRPAVTTDDTCSMFVPRADLLPSAEVAPGGILSA